MNNYGVCPHCKAVNPAGSARERSQFGKTVCGACSVPSLTMTWLCATNIKPTASDQLSTRVADLETENAKLQASVDEMEKTCGEWWSACSGIPAASPHTLRTALKEAGEKIVVLRNRADDADKASLAYMRERDEYRKRVADLEAEITKLATFICANVPGEPSQNESAVDTTIRLIGEYMDAKANLTDRPRRSKRKPRKQSDG